MKKPLYAPKDRGPFGLSKRSNEPCVRRFPALAVVTSCCTVTERHDIPGDGTRAVGRSERNPVVRNEHPEQAWDFPTDSTTRVPIIEGVTPCSGGIGSGEGAKPSAAMVRVEGFETLCMKASFFRAQPLPVGTKKSALCDTGKIRGIGGIESEATAILIGPIAIQSGFVSSIATLALETGTVRVSASIGKGTLNRARLTNTASVVEANMRFDCAAFPTHLNDGPFTDIMSNHRILLHRMLW